MNAMEPAFATNSQQPARDIPTEIYNSLWSIAIHGYQAKHVNIWYQTILQDLRQMASNSLQTGPSDPGMQTDCVVGQSVDFLDTDCAARRATLATVDSCISPITDYNALPSTEVPSIDGSMAQKAAVYNASAHDSTSQPYNTPQSYQTYTTTPQQLDTTPEPPQNQHLITNWSPAPSSAAEADIYALSAAASMSNGNLMAFAGDPTNVTQFNPWFSAQDLGSLHTRTRSQQSHISQHSLAASSQDLTQLPPQRQQQQQSYLAPEYNTPLSGTAMPVLVPYASSGGSGNYTKAAAISTGPGASFYSSSAGYFPIIHVSSSRRRRKAIQKGVKKMVQPLKGRRQQSV